MDPSSVDLKKTVNLPNTGFSMKANLPVMEPKLLAQWAETKLYDRIRETHAGQPMYVLHDGPPYANGNIHLGHAFNKILKDFVIKSKTMAGHDSPYVPGWDCHGLPIEIKVDGQLGSKKAKMSVAEIRRECRKYAQKFVDLQSQSFQRLGVLGRWDAPYTTMSAGYESVIAGAFVDFLSQGSVYKGLKPVNWCISCRTALAEAEVEYENHASPSIWVRFAMLSDAAKLSPVLAGRSVYGLIWTTTPWTIPANVGIAFHPTFSYSAVQADGVIYIVATDLVKVTAENCGWTDYSELVRFPGSELEGTVFQHPFLERESKGVLADYVTLEQGTGAVHTAPGHGGEDYATGQKYGLPTFCPVDAGGRFFHAEGAPGRLPEAIIGKTIWEANPIVSAIMAEAGALLGEKKLDHSYPHCWRCHKPTIFRATEQWFIGMELNGLREKALEAIKKVTWHPEWGQERISNMIATRPDWCISRQRVWGVPITVFYCEKCGETFTDRKYLDHVVALFREHTADIWYEKTAGELLGPEARCGKCGSGEFRKENDILDVWFDSGSSHLAVLREENGLPWPSSMYFEGGDQYRGWFHSSLLVGVGLKGEAPYKECATNGWALDGEGKAMSKSLGNVIEPEQIIKQYGADVLRLWVASVDFHEDVRMSELILQRLTDAYRKLRNTFRYTLGNLQDFDPAVDAVPAEELTEIDQWILYRAAALVDQCRTSYDEFSFHRVYQAVYNFATTDLSAVYFDVLKDRLYTSAPKSKARRSAQTALYRVNYALARLAAPLLAFTTDEVWSHMRRPAGAPESVHLSELPTGAELTAGLPDEHGELSANWDRLMEVRPIVLKSLETARAEKLIGAPLEAKVRVAAPAGIYPLLLKYQAELPGLFITSQVELVESEGDELAVTVLRADGVKCERCWKYTQDVGSDATFATVCAPCASAVHEIVGA
ncbi:MAG TPA: isoleucine--tRNA ligase [Paludibaculum sp.]|jgi:isoleucyl-tRNA synthetase